MCMRIWMAVSADQYELPLAIGDTAEELARALGVTRFAVYQTRRREDIGQRLNKYAVRVVTCDREAEGENTP